MSITIPQGGTVAGRSASVQIDMPDVGAVISRVGSAVAEKMGAIDQEQRAVRVSRAKIEMTKELGLEYQRISQLGDPAQIDAEWKLAEASIRDKFVNQKDEKGRQIWRPNEADALGLTAMDLGAQHAFNLGARNITLHESQQTADWMETRADLTTSAASADPVTMETLLQEGYARIDQRVEKGLILPDEGVTEKQALEAEVMSSRLTTAMAANPYAAQSDLNAGVYDALGPEKVASAKVNIGTAIAAQATADAKAAEAATRARSDALGKAMGKMADGMFAGRLVDGMEYVANATDEMKANPEWPKLEAAYNLFVEIPDLNTKTIVEFNALIAEEKQRKTNGEDWDNKRLTTLIEMRDKRVKGLTTDPKATLVEAGVITPTDLSFDPANPEAFATNLSDAISQNTHARETGQTSRSAIFTNDDRAALKSVLAPGADADAKEALATAIVMGAKGDTAAVLTDLEADPTFSRAVKILSLTGDTEVAKSILRGQQKLDLDTTLKLPRGDQIAYFDDFTGGAFDDASVQLRNELMAAANAIFADKSKGLDMDDPSVVKGMYDASLQVLFGAQSDRNGDYSVGGMHEVNGSKTVLPYGVTLGSVEGAWARLEDELAGRGTVIAAWPNVGAKLDPPPADPLRSFRAASIYDGAVPELGKDPAGRFAALTLRRVGESEVYELMVEKGGRMEPIRIQGTDRAYRFRLKDLVYGVQP